MLGKDEESGFSMTLETETCTTRVVNYENQGGKCNAGEVEAASYWNNLNEDIVGFIANKLHGSDYKHFRSVCKGNRAIMPTIKAASYLSPWLVFSRHQDYTIYNVLNPMYNNDNYAINLSDLAGCTICFQKGGWLLITRRENMFFYNPFTRETVRLPDIDIKRGDFYSVVCFSSLPTCSDCIVFVMDEKIETFCINFIRRGESHWSSCIFDKTHIGVKTSVLNTAVFHDGTFFCVNYLGTMDVFSAKDKSWRNLGKPHEQFDNYSFKVT
ncbi:F-box/kelch-repeat protein At1g57790-like [Papaver somniferum]|uniref:F-box/kelch-repeat protein At1g57790-like n=1 Tax=Papaver somniferum TaxID=3469 RepID=UPI000E6FB45F|nr:F-box/kelch-repeat protein At1g57790-like [Papaver somniferum]